jgi:hypothetical protein
MHRIVAAQSAISITEVLQRAGPNRLGAALVVTLVGWTALWASALNMIAFLPPWLGGVLFFAGLGLIPFAQSSSLGRRSPGIDGS